MKRIPYSFYKRGGIISTPSINQLVWYCDADKPDMRLVIINKRTCGGYRDRCDYWEWQEVFEDGTLGKEESGRDNFYEYHGFYKVLKTVEFN